MICAAVLTGPYWLRRATETVHPLLREYLAHTGQDTAGHGYGPDRVEVLAEEPGTPKASTMRTLAAVLTAWEDDTGVHTWRGPSQWDARIMTALTGWGYQPSEVEQLLLGRGSDDTVPNVA